MRRRLIAVLLIAGLVLPPMLISVRQAGAQQQLNTYPGGVVDIVTTTVTVANTAAATTLYSKNIPPRYFQQFRQPLLGAGALHLVLMGTVTTNQGVGSVGAANIGCNYGGTTASIALVNGYTFNPSLVAQPWQLDLYVRTQGTSTASEFVKGRFEVGNTPVTTNASATILNAATTGTTSTSANQTLTCVMQWGSAATTNSLVVNSAVLAIGQ